MFKFIFQKKLYLLTMMILVAVSFQSQAFELAILSTEEASAVTGATFQYCVMSSDGCWSEPWNCPPLTTPPCQTVCSSPWQNWSCEFIFNWYDGCCVTLDPRNCGTNDTGICAGPYGCIIEVEGSSCGTATDCEMQPDE